MKITIQKLAFKNLKQLTFAVLIAVAILSVVPILSYSLVINLFFSPFNFDLDRAIADNPLINIDFRTEETDQTEEVFKAIADKIYETISVDVDKKMDGLSGGYGQSGKYTFEIKPDKILPIEVYTNPLGVYNTEVYLTDGTLIYIGPEAKYYICKLEDTNFLVKVSCDSNLSTGDTIVGTFATPGRVVLKDVIETFSEHGYESINDLFKYEFDTVMDFSMGQELALMSSIICIGISLWLLSVVILQFIFPHRRPLYKKIRLLSGDIDTINEQLVDARRFGKNYITKDWIITPQSFNTQITRNK